MEGRLCENARSIVRGTIHWRSPLLCDGYREYADRAFVAALDRPDLADALGEFWPRGGPVWDGLATFRTPAGETAALLVEAKAHATEVLHGGTLGKSVAENSRQQIERSLAATRARLGVIADANDWTADRYQSANRLAHALWLGDHMPTVLAHVLFHDDPTCREESRSDLEAAACQVYRGLGFPGAKPAFAITVPCPGANAMELAPTTIPTWGSEPVAAGLGLTRGTYPPAPHERTRPTAPVWALVGNHGSQHDEIAVAAFREGLEFATLSVWWDGHEPVVAATPVQRVAWREFPAAPDASLAAVTLLARATSRRRRGSYRRCASCGDRIPPERRDRIDGRDVCQERFHGIVH